MENCPVCHLACSMDNSICPRCQFNMSQREFVSKEDAENWYHSEVLPFRANWLSTLSDFRINAMCLEEYVGQEKQLVIPKGVLHIGHSSVGFTDYQLDDRKSALLIQSVVIPEGVTTIKACAFQNCEKLECVNLPNSLVQIGGGAFAGCISLQNINLPDNLQVIEGAAFQACFKLQEVYIPQSVKYIESETFDRCVSLKRVYVGIDTTIDESAFVGCSTTLQIIRYSFDENKPSHIVWNGDDLDDDSYFAFEDEYMPNYELIIDKYIAKHQELLNEDSCFIKGENLIRYAGKNSVVTIANNTKSIGSCAFNNCTIERVVIPSSVVKIFSGAFSNCSKLTEIKLPSELQEISDLTFFRCIRLKSVEIPSEINRIGYRAFAGTAIENLTLPEKISKIDAGAFRWCSKLERIYLPDNLTTLHYGIFAYCKNLKSVSIPPKLQIIDVKVFYGCEKLTEIKLPDTLTSIGEQAFMYCKGLETIHIPQSVTHIGIQAFDGCLNLKNVVIPQHLSNITRHMKLRFNHCHEELTIQYY